MTLYKRVVISVIPFLALFVSEIGARANSLDSGPPPKGDIIGAFILGQLSGFSYPQESTSPATSMQGISEALENPANTVTSAALNLSTVEMSAVTAGHTNSTDFASFSATSALYANTTGASTAGGVTVVSVIVSTITSTLNVSSAGPIVLTTTSMITSTECSAQVTETVTPTVTVPGNLTSVALTTRLPTVTLAPTTITKTVTRVSSSSAAALSASSSVAGPAATATSPCNLVTIITSSWPTVISGNSAIISMTATVCTTDSVSVPASVPTVACSMPTLCTTEAILSGTSTRLTYLCPPTVAESPTQVHTVFETLTEYTTVTPITTVVLSSAALTASSNVSIPFIPSPETSMLSSSIDVIPSSVLTSSSVEPTTTVTEHRTMTIIETRTTVNTTSTSPWDSMYSTGVITSLVSEATISGPSASHSILMSLEPASRSVHWSNTTITDTMDGTASSAVANNASTMPTVGALSTGSIIPSANSTVGNNATVPAIPEYGTREPMSIYATQAKRSMQSCMVHGKCLKAISTQVQTVTEHVIVTVVLSEHTALSTHVVTSTHSVVVSANEEVTVVTVTSTLPASTHTTTLTGNPNTYTAEYSGAVTTTLDGGSKNGVAGEKNVNIAMVRVVAVLFGVMAI
ncbi:hypothetical protein GQ43DRAFT_256837 [Delitschia confertaspora ATCC 74209]|uniref:Uncharacterized protein n=1 Tax=Delitschia confertaspora ATCC 74209 TaxID=1513339 RepID=A0A9P4JEN2_9PLEO|nr:hypothetical protein GQ43DRAFT_256837 [Delitschia confertaspora ATCC 74209]